MTLKLSKGLAYLLLILAILFLAVLLMANINNSGTDLFGGRKQDAKEQESRNEQAGGKESTRKIEARDMFLKPGEIERVTDRSGSGTFYSLWYSTTSELVWLRVIIDGEVVWKNQTGVFGHGWAYNRRESSVGGVTSYGELATELGPVYGVYFKPSPVGLPFKESLKIEFGSDATERQLVYFASGFYSVTD